MAYRELDVLDWEKDAEISITHELDGLQAFKHIRSMMPPIGRIERLTVNLAKLPHVATTELYCLLAEMAADLLFRNVEINIVGLRGGRMDGNKESVT